MRGFEVGGRDLHGSAHFFEELVNSVFLNQDHLADFFAVLFVPVFFKEETTLLDQLLPRLAHLLTHRATDKLQQFEEVLVVDFASFCIHLDLKEVLRFQVGE